MVLILMFSKILKNMIIQTITWCILLLSLCTSKRDMLNDGWNLWPGRPNVIYDPGSAAPPLFQFLPGFPPFLLCLPAAVYAKLLGSCSVSVFFLLQLAVLPLGFFQDFVCTFSVFAVCQDVLLDLNLIPETCVKRAVRELALTLWEEVLLPL